MFVPETREGVGSALLAVPRWGLLRYPGGLLCGYCMVAVLERGFGLDPRVAKRVSGKWFASLDSLGLLYRQWDLAPMVLFILSTSAAALGKETVSCAPCLREGIMMLQHTDTLLGIPSGVSGELFC
ncbi:hypothetical protein RND81_03G001200 [Saponaria officinalis]|uniref:Uncharacterized protein n=1 Tax=Saponaria officinalis TaxID=3572 RepID=A0AAW1LBX4_SAPOF